MPKAKTGTRRKRASSTKSKRSTTRAPVLTGDVERVETIEAARDAGTERGSERAPGASRRGARGRTRRNEGMERDGGPSRPHAGEPHRKADEEREMAATDGANMREGENPRAEMSDSGARRSQLSAE